MTSSKLYVALGFCQYNSDTFLFIRRNTIYLILVLIYFDDILITCPNTSQFETFIAQFSVAFALKNLGILSYFLGIKVYDAGCIHLSQRKYRRELLTKVEMIDRKGIDTLMGTGTKLKKLSKGNLDIILTILHTIGDSWKNAILKY